MPQPKVENRLLRPGEVLNEFPELETEHHMNERDIGRLLTTGILTGISGRNNCRVERYSVLALVQHMNNLNQRKHISVFEFWDNK